MTVCVEEDSEWVCVWIGDLISVAPKVLAQLYYLHEGVERQRIMMLRRCGRWHGEVRMEISNMTEGIRFTLDRADDVVARQFLGEARYIDKEELEEIFGCRLAP